MTDREKIERWEEQVRKMLGIVEEGLAADEKHEAWEHLSRLRAELDLLIFSLRQEKYER